MGSALPEASQKVNGRVKTRRNCSLSGYREEPDINRNLSKTKERRRKGRRKGGEEGDGR